MPTLAILTAVCNSTDYIGRHGGVQIEQALTLAASLRALGSEAQLVAMTYAFDPAARAALARAGYDVRDYSSEAPGRFALAPRFEYTAGQRWPRGKQSEYVQRRLDGACTSLKFFAWDSVGYDGVLLSDTDVAFFEDPLPWMEARLAENEYFHASREVTFRNYDGLNTHLVWLRPDRQIFKMLVDAGRLGNFIPYTNGEQDVIEALFTDHRPGLAFPKHAHSKAVYCACSALLLMRPAQDRRPPNALLDGASVVLRRIRAFERVLACPPQRRLVHEDGRCVAEALAAAPNASLPSHRLEASLASAIKQRVVL